MGLLALGIPLILPFVAVVLGLLHIHRPEPDVTQGFRRDTTWTESGRPLEEELFSRTTLHFDSQGEVLEAWLYMPHEGPTQTRPLPVVLMANGIGVQKDMYLHSYAEKFASAGLAVMAFDYRTFGGSDGEPRHWASPARYLQDWWAALQFVREGGLGPHVNPGRIALWGVSYAGGHVLVTAARAAQEAAAGKVVTSTSEGAGGAVATTSTVTAVVAVEPYLTSAGALRAALEERGPLRVARLAAVALADALRGLLGLDALYVPIVGSHRHLAVLALNDADYDLHVSNKGRAGPPPRRQGGWQNKLVARSLLGLIWYKPVHRIPFLGSTPVFFRAALRDGLCPAPLVRHAAGLAPPGSELLEIDDTHLGAMSCGLQEQHFAPMLAFLHRHLLALQGEQQQQGVQQPEQL